MRFCEKCGKKLEDEMMFCPYCGQTSPTNTSKDDIDSVDESVTPNEVDSSSKQPVKKKKISKKLIIMLALVLAVGIAALIILPRPNLKMGDIKDQGVFATICQYGIPSESDDEYLRYNNVVKFYGLIVKSLRYDKDTGAIRMELDNYSNSNSRDDIENLFSDLRSKCSLISNYYADWLYSGEYKGANVTVQYHYNGGSIIVEIEF